ncbi:MAG: coproporphyrinogen III oxidase [Desulfococcus sp. 4484_242]|nr:MAG: coproporphyrinogen III oxidase [Desulfococcus sp. 4484_242]
MSPGVYVHIPFCRSKCPYCGFYSVPSKRPVPIWFEGIKKEIRLYKGLFGRFDSLYLGGGTPTFLDDAILSCLTDHLFAHFDFTADREFTIEANPCDLSAEKIRLLKDLGINRVNVGIQSFDDGALAFLGRRHTGREAENSLKRLRRLGFRNIGVDLIYGLPGQTLEHWEGTLNQALLFQPEHISCYELTLEEQTVFGRLQEKGEMHGLSEEDGRAFFLAAAKRLGEAGYVHYEVSNYARTEAFCCRHNSKYWNRSPYLGLGPSAHSFDGTERWWNVRSVRHYGALLKRGSPPIQARETLTKEQIRLESLALGFRTSQGVALTRMALEPRSTEMLSTLKTAGLLKLKDGRVVPTEEGFLVADSLPLCFFP